jgi:hypothetical protein
MPLWLQPFNEQFRIIGSDGQPLAFVPYYIRDEAGQVDTGFSDESGHTPRIATKNRKHWKLRPAWRHWKSGVTHD